MCITRELLAKFYGDSAFFAMRTLIHYRVLATFGRSLEYFSWRSLGGYTQCWRKPSAGTT
jgi:hypothetical protein